MSIKKLIILVIFVGIKADDLESCLSFLTEDIQKKVIAAVEPLFKNLQDKAQFASVENQTMKEDKKKLLHENNRLSAESNIYRDKLSVTHQQLKQFEGTWGKVKGPVKITEPPLPKNLYYIYNNAYDDLSHFCYYIFDFFFAGSAYYSSPYKS